MSSELLFKRMISNVRVRIKVRYYRPEERWLKYEGQLDGLRFLFGRYTRPKLQPFIYCSGPIDRDMRKRRHIIDGTLPWVFWDEVTI